MRKGAGNKKLYHKRKKRIARGVAGTERYVYSIFIAVVLRAMLKPCRVDTPNKSINIANLLTLKSKIISNILN